MRVKHICGNTRWDLAVEPPPPQPPVCEAVWIDDNIDAALWARDEAVSSCHECGGIKYQRDGGHEVIDYGLPLAVCLLVRDEGGQILAVSRKDDPTAFGLPGGKVDPQDGELHPEARGDTLRRAMVREVREELGVNIDPDLLVFEFQHPDATGYWNFCFTVEHEHLAGAKTQTGEGVVAWVDWATLERGPFGDFNTALHAHLWAAERFLDPEATSDAEVDEYLRAHGGDPEAIGERGAALVARILGRSED